MTQIMFINPQKVHSGPPLPCGTCLGGHLELLNGGEKSVFRGYRPARVLKTPGNHAQSIRNQISNIPSGAELFLSPSELRDTRFWCFSDLRNKHQNGNFVLLFCQNYVLPPISKNTGPIPIMFGSRENCEFSLSRWHILFR